MLNLNFATLVKAYRHYAVLTPAELSETLGWAGQAGSPGHPRNGALLTSLALLAANVPLTGPVKIEAGPLAGRQLQNGANRLADWLVERHGAPETIPLDGGLGAVADQLFARRGIVAFMQNAGPGGGSIALLDGHNAAALCVEAQTLHPIEVRFWAIS
ncbi:MAG: hypothetical protein H6R15_445 [Proteobacteria bacterium]|nr:hypothetical protein [Pseudomonadota bacterium]